MPQAVLLHRPRIAVALSTSAGAVWSSQSWRLSFLFWRVHCISACCFEPVCSLFVMIVVLSFFDHDLNSALYWCVHWLIKGWIYALPENGWWFAWLTWLAWFLRMVIGFASYALYQPLSNYFSSTRWLWAFVQSSFCGFCFCGRDFPLLSAFLFIAWMRGFKIERLQGSFFLEDVLCIRSCLLCE